MHKADIVVWQRRSPETTEQAAHHGIREWALDAA